MYQNAHNQHKIGLSAHNLPKYIFKRKRSWCLGLQIYYGWRKFKTSAMISVLDIFILIAISFPRFWELREFVEKSQFRYNHIKHCPYSTKSFVVFVPYWCSYFYGLELSFLSMSSNPFVTWTQILLPQSFLLSFTKEFMFLSSVFLFHLLWICHVSLSNIALHYG